MSTPNRTTHIIINLQTRDVCGGFPAHNEAQALCLYALAAKLETFAPGHYQIFSLGIDAGFMSSEQAYAVVDSLIEQVAGPELLH